MRELRPFPQVPPAQKSQLDHLIVAVASETREGGEAARAAGVAIADAVASLLVAFPGSEVRVRGSLRGSFGGESVALDGEVGSCVMREQGVSVKRCHFCGDGLEDVKYHSPKVSGRMSFEG